MAETESGTAALWVRFRNWPILVQILAWIYLWPFVLVLMALGRSSPDSAGTSGTGRAQVRSGFLFVTVGAAVVLILAAAVVSQFYELELPAPEPEESVAGASPSKAVEVDLTDVLEDGPLGGKVPGADGDLRTSLRRVQATPVDAGYMVTVQFVAGDNFTANARRETMIREAGRAMASVYKTEHNIADVTVQAFFPAVDDLGNSSLAKVYEATLFRADAMRANLDDPDRVNWQALWNGGFVRDDF